MSGVSSKYLLRKLPRLSYYEPEELDLDQYIFCTQCEDYVYEYCSIHGPLLVVPDNKVPKHASSMPRAALTIPNVFLHIAPSTIPGAGLGVFCTLTLPMDVRFGPYVGKVTKEVNSDYCWQIFDRNRSPLHMVDASDANASNWLRYVNCSRNFAEQNLIAFQYRGRIYYRTIKIIPRGSELLVYYGSEFAKKLGVDLRRYNSPAHTFGVITTYTQPTEIQDTISTDLVLYQPELVPNPPGLVPNQPDMMPNQPELVPNQPKLVPNRTEMVPYQPEMMQIQQMPETSEENELIVLQKVGDQLMMIEEWNTDFDSKSSYSTDFDNSNSGLEQYKETPIKVSQILENPKNIVEPKRKAPIQKCNMCDFKSTIQEVLQKHSKLHDPTRAYACNQCNNRFENKLKLDRHSAIHKDYTCDVCNDNFKAIKDLMKHKRKHAIKKIYKCNICDYETTRSTSLTNHMKSSFTHGLFKCQLCDFTTNGRLQYFAHTKTHDGEQECVMCDYKTTKGASMAAHLQWHEKKYECDKCEHKYSYAHLLERHRYYQHGEKL